MSGYVYLATPYTKYPHGISIAYQDALHAAGALIGAGIPVYSPIVHMHPIATKCPSAPKPTDSAKWIAVDYPMMESASACIVVAMEEWNLSTGVAAEIGFFTGAEKPVIMMEWPITTEVIDDVVREIKERCPSCGL